LGLVGGEGSSLPPGASLTTFTTRADTLFGVTYVCVAPEHPLVAALTTENPGKLTDEDVEGGMPGREAWVRALALFYSARAADRGSTPAPPLPPPVVDALRERTFRERKALIDLAEEAATNDDDHAAVANARASVPDLVATACAEGGVLAQSGLHPPPYDVGLAGAVDAMRERGDVAHDAFELRCRIADAFGALDGLTPAACLDNQSAYLDRAGRTANASADTVANKAAAVDLLHKLATSAGAAADGAWCMGAFMSTGPTGLVALGGSAELHYPWKLDTLEGFPEGSEKETSAGTYVTVAENIHATKSGKSDGPLFIRGGTQQQYVYLQLGEKKRTLLGKDGRFWVASRLFRAETPFCPFPHHSNSLCELTGQIILVASRLPGVSTAGDVRPPAVERRVGEVVEDMPRGIRCYLAPP